ncbi:hypothetical protein [Agrobacterium albertimagni]|nr:hypothetical protein [Agrobacterium albertimagni]
MTSMSMDEVQAVLAPYHSQIQRVVVDSYEEWQRVSSFRAMSGYSPVLYSRTMANYVFDAIARNAQSTFSCDRTVLIRQESQTIKFIFGGKVIVRFKKGDEDNLGKNILTQAVLDYLDPQQILPGFPPEAAKVEIVWSSNEIGTSIEEILVVARDRHALLWSYRIDDEAGGVDESGVLPFPTGPGPDEFSPLVVIKPRKSERESK